jgi:hypothetical protein
VEINAAKTNKITAPTSFAGRAMKHKLTPNPAKTMLAQNVPNRASQRRSTSFYMRRSILALWILRQFYFIVSLE